MEGLPSHKQILFDSQYISTQIGHQVVLEEYANGDRIHLYIPQESPDAGLSEPKLVVTHTIK
jgi:hypothetical protein